MSVKAKEAVGYVSRYLMQRTLICRDLNTSDVLDGTKR